MKLEVGKAMVTEISQNMRVSVMKWSDTEFNTRVYFNNYPKLNPNWIMKEAEVLIETELQSEMQVLDFIDDSRRMYAKFG